MATTMRLDKYLKVSRLIKRRTVAKEVAEKGRIAVNGVTAKPGTNVKSGDELVIRFGPKNRYSKNRTPRRKCEKRTSN